MVAVVDVHNGLGFENQLLCHLPADLKHFKEITWGKPIVMGYKTYESIGRLLPGRKNIILSRNNREIPGATIVHSIEELLLITKDEPELMIIGGGAVFALFFEKADQIYLTRIQHEFRADVFFPILDPKAWQCTEERYLPRDIKNKYDMIFYKYNKIKKI